MVLLARLNHAEPEISLRDTWIQLQSGTITFGGFGELLGFHQSGRQIEVGDFPFGVEFDGFGQVLDGFVELFGGGEQRSEVELSLGVFGIPGDDLSESLERTFRLASGLIDHGQIDQRRGVVGVDAQRFLE